MPSHRLLIVCVLAASVCGAVGSLPSAAQTPTPPTALGPPRQITPYEAPATYPYGGSMSPSTTAGTSASVTTDTGEANVRNDSDSPYTAYGSFDATSASLPPDGHVYIERSLLSEEHWSWHILPSGLMYKSYLAGNREPRMGTQWFHERTLGWRWDSTLGGRVGLLRYGTDDDFWPQGWQLDFEGAAFPRLNLERMRDLDTVDFRAGVPLTTRQGCWEFKFGYYHLSSHLGDEYVIDNPAFPRINYVRESLLSGLAVYPNPSVRLYAEAGWAFYIDGGAKPWEFQFGVDLSPAEPTGGWGAPFFAINGHLRQENDFGGNMTVQTGWQWRGRTGHLLRFGAQYFNGMSDQYQFFDRFEEQIGMGFWYDF